MKNQILILMVAFLSATTFSQTRKDLNLKDKIAIQGYDPVAYFESNKAVKGKKEITAEYDTAIYYFSTQENKALFQKNPAHYTPQFGGFCAYAMSEGKKATILPQAFTIVDNKLYLNYNLEVRELWLKEQSARIVKANSNWEKIKNE